MVDMCLLIYSPDNYLFKVMPVNSAKNFLCPKRNHLKSLTLSFFSGNFAQVFLDVYRLK